MGACHRYDAFTTGFACNSRTCSPINCFPAREIAGSCSSQGECLTPATQCAANDVQTKEKIRCLSAQCADPMKYELETMLFLQHVTRCVQMSALDSRIDGDRCDSVQDQRR
jgi:hypothetical protein